jgi:hypothetical protein
VILDRPGRVISASSDRSVCWCCRNRRSPIRRSLNHSNRSRPNRNQCPSGPDVPPSLGQNLSLGRHHCQSQNLGCRHPCHQNVAGHRILGGRVPVGLNHWQTGRRAHPDAPARGHPIQRRPMSRRRHPIQRRSGCSTPAMQGRSPSDRASVWAPSGPRPSARLRSPSDHRIRPNRPTSEKNPTEPPRRPHRDDRARPRPAGPASQAQPRRGLRRSQATPRTHRWGL